MTTTDEKDLNEIRICSLKKDDINDVLEIQKECGLSFWSRLDYLKEIEREDSIAKTAEFENEQVIGFAIVRLLLNSHISENDPVYFAAEIYNIAVKESFQKKKIGQKIFDEIINELKAKGVSEIWLEVRKSNIKAQNFYRKNGFTEHSVRKNYYKNPLEDALVMKFW
jgi:ribosomal-protein-alanine N-acetyltransferase